MPEHKRHRDVPKERFFEDPPRRNTGIDEPSRKPP